MNKKNIIIIGIIVTILICTTIFVFCTKFYKTKKIIYWKDYIEITNEYPHNKEIFTQGIFFYNNILYETGGLYGKSCIYKEVNLNTGNAKQIYKFDNSIFAEGSTVLNDKLYVLTYKEHKAFVFNIDTLEIEKEYNYLAEGWGLTTDGENLIASDGSSNLYFMDKNFNILRKLSVKINRKTDK